MIPQYIDDGIFLLIALSLAMWFVNVIAERCGAEEQIKKGYIEVLNYFLGISVLVLLIDNILVKIGVL